MRALHIAALAALYGLGAAAGATPAAAAPTGDAFVWAKLCGQENPHDGAGGAVCFTGSAGDSAVTAAVIEPRDGPGKAVLRIAVPGPLQLQYGARLSIDDDPPLAGRFLTCYASRCVADREATPDLVARLAAGATLRIEAVGLSGAAVSFALPLSQPGNSFRTATAAPPVTDAALFDERQNQLLAYARPLAGAAVPEQASVYSPWEKFCGREHDADAGEVCFTGRDARSGDGRELVAVALIETAGDRSALFRVNLPGPLRLGDGVRLTIDHDEPLPAPFSTCYADACMADYQATPQLLARLKGGGAIAVAATDLEGRAVSFTLPLSDPPASSFASAHDGPAVDPDAFAQQQKRLQADLKRRADEMRRSLESGRSAK